MEKKYALIGVGGFIAPRHLKAIKETGGELVATCDVHDSVGILDSYFPDASFFTEPERFDRHLEMLRRRGDGVDYLVVCTPNYLHDAHIRMGLRLEANVICEKPIVIKAHNINALQELEQETYHKVYPVLQLRYHPAIIKAKEKYKSGFHKVRLSYFTPRGIWYDYSWKGDKEKSGGLPMNIGVHFFDALQWIFGGRLNGGDTLITERGASGKLNLERATVDWDLSIAERQKQRTIIIDGEEIDFTEGFENLHTEVYKDILSGGGFGLEDARNAIEIVGGL